MNKHIKSSRFFQFSIIVFVILCAGCGGTADITRCGSAEYFQEKMETDPKFRDNFNRIEGLIQNYYKTVEKGAAGLRAGRIIIPVVVHVLHNGEAEGTGTNISDAQIHSQIAVMNLDFRRLNADISTVPATFSGLTADSRIEFQLAMRDPDCNSTNGITRQRAGTTPYTVSGNEAKSSSTGGVDPWDTNKYLNMWVVPNIVGDAIGYSSFPADAVNLYGFVCESDVFGNTGSVSPTSSFNLGRTAVHEFGHFFNLFHIWRTGGCGNSDEVDDTPNQDDDSPVDSDPLTAGVQCPVHPSTSCGSTDMWMNYMDYVGDPCMVMFSQGQVDRMIATLYSTVANLIGSDGLLPPPDDGGSADLYIQDTPEDIGNEPNNESDRFYISEDIWVRNTRGTTNQEHENPEYTSGSSVYVYVRVRNSGCASSENANVRLYWAKASSGLSWTAPWDGSVTIDGALMGEEIGVKPTGVIPGGGFTILEYEWSSIPNPADYASFGADRTHFCLLARIETSGGMSFPETSNLGENVKNNNNIAWKNIDIATSSSRGRESTILIGNYEKNREYEITLAFEDANKIEASVFDFGEVFIELHPKLIEKWELNGSKGNEVKRVGDNLIKINRSGATMEGILLNPKEIYSCTIIFKEGQPILGPYVYFMDLLQYEGKVSANKLIGGQRFLIKSWNR
jgi:hypothetical protein